MAYTPDPYDDTQPIAGSVRAQEAAPEFRAIKTALIAHKAAIDTTLPGSVTSEAAARTAADAALDARLDAVESQTGYKYKQHLSGSGNFTVPAGITEIEVDMQGGGRGMCYAYTYPASSAPYRWFVRVDAIPAEHRKVVLTVTPGDVIAYAVGANDVLAETFTGGTAGQWSVAASTAATNSTFGSLTALKGAIAVDISYQSGVAPITATAEDSAVGGSGVKTFPVGNSAGVGGTSQESTARTITNGRGAYITVRW